MQPVSVVGTPMPPAVSDRVARLAMRSWFAFVVAFLQLGAAITLLCLTRYSMEAIIYSTTPNAAVIWDYTCFLSSDLSPGHCQYSYALGAVSIVFSACLFMMQCVQCDDIMTHGARLCEGVVDLLGFGWWLAGAIVLTLEANQIKGLKVTMPNQSYRDGILAMAWLSVALFFLMLCFTIGTGIRVRSALRKEHKVDAAPKPAPLEAAV